MFHMMTHFPHSAQMHSVPCLQQDLTHGREMSSSVSLSCLLEIFLITSGKKRKISTADQEILWQAPREDMLRAAPIEAGRRRRRISSAAPNNSCPRRTTPRRRRRRGPRPSRRIERAIECSSPFPFPLIRQLSLSVSDGARIRSGRRRSAAALVAGQPVAPGPPVR